MGLASALPDPEAVGLLWLGGPAAPAGGIAWARGWGSRPAFLGWLALQGLFRGWFVRHGFSSR